MSVSLDLISCGEAPRQEHVRNKDAPLRQERKDSGEV